jgi:hypothetical protein
MRRSAPHVDDDRDVIRGWTVFGRLSIGRDNTVTIALPSGGEQRIKPSRSS